MAEFDRAKAGGTYRFAWAAVIFLSILLVAAIMAVAAGFARQYQLLRAGSSGPAAVLQLAPGAHILSATSESGRLVLHLATPQGGEVEIIDLASGRLVSVVKEQPQ